MNFFPPKSLDENPEFDQFRHKRFLSLLEGAAFWDMPFCDRAHGFRCAQAILEGVSAGRYHVVDRWSPHDTPYAELVEFILGRCPDGCGEP